ncbi:arsenate reductase/protein-tyrosine-phosphatase family protein [Nocardioides marmoribigeumensis]|uniref:Protein-tyrosine phosphatase n=1 Tax=Nocardioides marmoribigeumensis TaxID=433649 RepID=A0ABU2BVE5_9ACTN|nr:hypothetical protein [Nocardioides marmoribigeumensis]MDR7361979.1 protein-tyrosine phosphatase [Nocardioides marmoribigeumensis]
MAEPFRLLSVCIGNVCRSPVAERLLQLRLAEFGAASQCFSVASAGTRALVGHAMTDESLVQLGERGGSAHGFVARRLDESMVRAADLVLTATTAVRRTALEEAPGALRRTFTWRELAALVDGRTAGSAAALVADAAARRGEVAGLDLDTEDPMGQPAEVYARVAAEIDEAVTVIARALAASQAP